MLSLRINGRIVTSDDAEIFDWLGWESASPKSLRDFLKNAKGEDVELLINSYGGDVHAAAEMYGEIKRYKGHVKSVIVGLAASAATVVALGADRVVAYPMAQMMIHNVSTFAAGDHNDMESAKQSLETADAGLRAIYTRKTGKSMDELKALMDAETWFSAQTALDAGFVDAIIEPEVRDMVASSGSNEPDMKMLRELYAQKKAEPATATIEAEGRVYDEIKIEEGKITMHNTFGGFIEADQIVVHENEEGHQLTDWQETANKKLEIEKQRFGDRPKEVKA
jgi:ATP-dependent Clp protease protease subunit